MPNIAIYTALTVIDTCCGTCSLDMCIIFITQAFFGTAKTQEVAVYFVYLCLSSVILKSMNIFEYHTDIFVRLVCVPFSWLDNIRTRQIAVQDSSVL